MSLPPPSTSVFTRDLRHLFSSPRLKRLIMRPTGWQKVMKKLDHQDIVPDQQRIMKWNIVPGDSVRRVPNRFSPTDKPEKFEVLSIDKFQNKVYLKGTKHRDGNVTHLPYAMCQLYIGSIKKNGKEVDVYATRVGSTNPKYNWRKKRFEWARYAEATVPPTTWNKQQRAIPWPKEEPETMTAPPSKYYDTVEADAHEMSWKPFTPMKIPSFIEDEYISDLYNNKDGLPATFQSYIPMEHTIVKELMNPLSRAHRQKRWQEQAEMLERSKQDYIKAEVQDLKGRRKEDAKRDGEFRWKMAVQKYKARINWKRWVQRGGKAKLELRVKRRQRLTARKLRRLKAMQLKEGKNQSIPSRTSSSASAS